MSGYIEVGYVIVLGSLATYATSLVSRERAARRRLPPSQRAGAVPEASPGTGPAAGEQP
ncbi:MAG: hypothetical protein WAL04_00040 [Acidimicrobiales bacterium]|jgi:hypothetical protein